MGHWENVDPNTGGLVAVDFYMDGDQLMVHAYGACSPAACDLGVAPVTLYSTGVENRIASSGTAEFDHGFAVDRLIIRWVSKLDQIVIQTMCEMNDSRYNFRQVDRFETVRPLAGSWSVTYANQYDVTLKSAGPNRYRLCPSPSLVCEGLYRVEGDKLVMIEPTYPEGAGMIWEIVDNDCLVLTNSAWAGAYLTRNPA